MKQYFRT